VFHSNTVNSFCTHHLAYSAAYIYNVEIVPRETMKKKSTVSTITKRCNSNVENLKEETFPCNESVQ